MIHGRNGFWRRIGLCSPRFSVDSRQKLCTLSVLMFLPKTADEADMDISAIAIQGLQQADAQLTDAAMQIANYGSDLPQGANLDVVDLSAAMVELMAGKVQFAANLKVLHTVEQVQQKMLDVKA